MSPDEWVAQQAATWPPMSDQERSLLIRLFKHFARTQQTGEPPGARQDEGPPSGKRSGPQDERELVESTFVAADADPERTTSEYPLATHGRGKSATDVEVD